MCARLPEPTQSSRAASARGTDRARNRATSTSTRAQASTLAYWLGAAGQRHVPAVNMVRPVTSPCLPNVTKSARGVWVAHPSATPRGAASLASDCVRCVGHCPYQSATTTTFAPGILPGQRNWSRTTGTGKILFSAQEPASNVGPGQSLPSEMCSAPSESCGRRP